MFQRELLGHRGKILGRTYIPSKLRKYGMKIFWITEAKSGYALKGQGQLYTGKIIGEIQRDLGKHVDLNLTKPFYNSGREIVTDNFFTSHSLAVELLKHNLTLLGTIRSHRKEIPEILRKRRDQWSLLSFFLIMKIASLLSLIYRKRITSSY